MDFEESIKPFFMVEYDGGVSVCLNADGGYLSEVFEARADEGFEGRGYDWESLARVFVEEKCPHLSENINFDPEAGMFSAYSEEKEVVIEFITKFKAACDDKELITDLFSRAELD